MKGIALIKSWDDVFPDNQCPDTIPATDKQCMLNSDMEAPPTRDHSQSSSVTEISSPMQQIFAQSFHNLKTEARCPQTGSKRTERCSKSSHLASLQKDVAELQSRLQHEQAVNRILNQALGQASSATTPTSDSLTPRPTQDLIRDIAMLELEVAQLEQHLLTLYRNTFEQNWRWISHNSAERSTSSSSKTIDGQKQQLRISNSLGKLIMSDKQGFHSQSLSEYWQDGSHKNIFLSESNARQSMSACTSIKKESKSFSSYSQPISLPQETPMRNIRAAQGAQRDISFDISREVDLHAVLEGTPCHDLYGEKVFRSQSPLVVDLIMPTPNKLSEDLVCCMAAIYCRLAEPPLPHIEGIMSSSSSSSSASTFTTHRFSNEGCTLQWKSDGSWEVPFSLRNQDVEGAWHSSFTVEWISVDNDRLTYAARMLRTFRSMVQQLEKVDPSGMTHEEKLAFWINVHNALMMHAYLAYGIPRNHLKRVALLQKAAYKVGGHSVNAQTIQQTILKCRCSRPAKWLQVILSPTSKLKSDDRQKYAIDHPEPLLCFALCCGGRSDPMVRVYTKKAIHQELEVAKQEFLDTNVTLIGRSKIQLPWILDTYAKEANLRSSELVTWICENMEEKAATSFTRLILQANGKVNKCIEWSPYDFRFRYIFMSPSALRFSNTFM